MGDDICVITFVVRTTVVRADETRYFKVKCNGFFPPLMINGGREKRGDTCRTSVGACSFRAEQPS